MDEEKREENRESENLRLARQTTQLALERTFAAWVRTGLASIAGGFAFVRLIEFENPGHRILADLAGEILILIALLIFIFSSIDYRANTARLGIKVGMSIRYTLYIIIPLILFGLLMTFIIFFEF